jgi:hypothetical protein
MGLFSRTNTGANGQDDFDEIDLPTSDDLKGGLFTEPTKPAPVAVTAPVKRNPPVRGTYGIEDAIKLMKSLPRDNNEVVVTVVKKTLESTSIKVHDIVDDANQKEARIRNQHKTLEGEIKDLQDQIAHRNQQISDLLHDLKETTDVRQRLQLAMELDGDKAAPAPAVAAPKSDAAESNAAPVQTTAPAGPQTVSGTANSTHEQNMRRRAQQRSNPQH